MLSVTDGRKVHNDTIKSHGNGYGEHTSYRTIKLHAPIKQKSIGK